MQSSGLSLAIDNQFALLETSIAQFKLSADSQLVCAVDTGSKQVSIYIQENNGNVFIPTSAGPTPGVILENGIAVPKTDSIASPVPAEATHVSPAATEAPVIRGVPAINRDYIDATLDPRDLVKYATEADLQARVAELSATWMLPDTFNGAPIMPITVDPAQKDSFGDTRITVHFLNRYNFYLRDLIQGPDGRDEALCEVLLPDGQHIIIKVHSESVLNGDKAGLRRGYNLLISGGSLSMDFVTKLGKPSNKSDDLKNSVSAEDPGVVKSLSDGVFPASAADTTLVVTGTGSGPFPPGYDQ
jgi:hypothetical protein